MASGLSREFLAATVTLNEPFSREEMDAVLQQLKRNKAADLQGLRAEQLKEPATLSDAATGSTEDGTADVQQVFAEPLMHLCNLYLSAGTVLAELAEA
jgi:hypothetical protein